MTSSTGSVAAPGSGARSLRRFAPVTCTVIVLVAVPLFSAERLSDVDVKALIERIDHERDRFEDQLDGKLKGSILRGTAGEVDVSRYLDDFEENLDRLQDRFRTDYAGSAEVTTVLRQGSDIQRFMATQPPDIDGASEWNRLASSLGALASAYGTTMPIAAGQQARRLNDDEVEKVADDLANSVDRFKNDLESSLASDKTIDKATRDAAVSEVAMLKDQARRLASVVDDGRPASGEAKALFDTAARVRAAASKRSLPPAAKTAWNAVANGLGTLAQAFGEPARW